MKPYFHITALSIFYLTAFLLVSCTSEEEPSQTEGNTNVPFEVISIEEAAPAVEQAVFEDLEGNSVNISDFEGRVVLIDFWETWCTPCLNSFPTMQQLMEEYPDDFVVLAVTPGMADSREDARAFSEEYDYDFVYLYDVNTLHRDLDIQAIPFKVFVSADGDLVDISFGSAGPEGDYEHAEAVVVEHRGS